MRDHDRILRVTRRTLLTGAAGAAFGVAAAVWAAPDGPNGMKRAVITGLTTAMLAVLGKVPDSSAKVRGPAVTGNTQVAEPGTSMMSVVPNPMEAIWTGDVGVVVAV